MALCVVIRMLKHGALGTTVGGVAILVRGEGTSPGPAGSAAGNGFPPNPTIGPGVQVPQDGLEGICQSPPPGPPQEPHATSHRSPMLLTRQP